MEGAFAESYWGPNLLFWLIAIVIGLIPAKIAANKGRSFVAWWIYGALVFIIALPHALFLKPIKTDAPTQQQEKRKCPFCGEMVASNSKFCPFCGKDLTNVTKAIAMDMDDTSIPMTAQGDTSKTTENDLASSSNEPHSETVPSNKQENTSPEDVKPKTNKKTPSAFAIIGLVFGVMCLFVPYFALLFFAPVSLACGIISIYKGEKKMGVATVILAIIGILWVIHVSNEISAIFNH